MVKTATRKKKSRKTVDRKPQATADPGSLELKWLADDLNRLRRAVHDEEVQDYIDNLLEFERTQPSDDPFELAADTKSVASIVMAFKVLRELLPVYTGTDNAILSSSSVKTIGAIVKKEAPRARYFSLIADNGEQLVPLLAYIAK